MTLATKITLLRVLSIVPIMYLINLQTFQASVVGLILFIFAALTDYLDGYIARKTDTETDLGSLMDLLADKLLVCLTLIWLIKFNTSSAFVIPAMIIVFREFIIFSLRQFIAELQIESRLEVSFMGKSKTTIQLIATSLIIISPIFGPYFYSFSLLFLWISSLMSLLSLYFYFQKWSSFIN